MNEELRIIISAEIDKLKQELQKGQQELKKFEKEGKGAGSKVASALKAGGQAVGVAMKAMVAGVAAAGAALVGLTESTREYRTQQAMLASAFQTSGSNAEMAKETYNDLYRVLGDSGKATEAAQHLAMLTTEEQALSEWTTICQGVYAKFGDSLPIESLTEAANETAKTGELTGALADALNWAGVSEEAFKDQLFLCNTEAEREALIRETLTGLYKDSAAAYEENAKAILDANEAQAKLTDGLAQLGGAIEPVMTAVKAGLGNMLADMAPSLTLVSEGLTTMLSGGEGGAEKVTQGIQGLVDTLIQTITNALPTILKIGLDIVTALIQGITQALPDIIQCLADILPQIVTAIGDLLPMLTGAILNALPMIIETILQVVSQILVTLGDILPEIVLQIVQIIPQIISAITDNIPVLLEAAITFLLAIVEAIPVIVKELIKALPQIIDSILDAVTNAIPLLIEGSIALLMGIVEAIPQILPALIDALPLIINSIVDFLIDNLPVVIDGAIQVFMALVMAIPEIIPELISQLGTIVATVLTTLGARLPEIFKSLWDNFLSGGSKAFEGIKNIFKKIPEWFKNIFTSAWTAVKNVFSAGGKIFDGIKDGILNGLKVVINGIIKGINKVIKVPFDGINSALSRIKGISIAGLKPFDWIKTFNVPQIPLLARGGVLEKGQVGLLEGSGAEAVVPLENNDAWLSKLAEKLAILLGERDGNDGRPIVLEVDGKTFARTSIKSINQLTKQTGKLDLVLT